MNQLAQSFRVLQLAEEIGLLNIERGYVGGEQLPDGLRVGFAVFDRNQAHFVAGAVAIGGNGIDHVRMGRSGHQSHPALPLPAHGGCFCGGGGAVVTEALDTSMPVSWQIMV